MDSLNGKPLIVIAGPTAVGKTAASVRLAERIGGEIISADSMQVYRGMDIGSAKASLAERLGIPHHLLDIVEPSESFSVARYQKYAYEALQDIYSRGKIPILVGGTGFYIQAVLYGIDFTEEDNDPLYRAYLYRIAEEEGPDTLYRMLQETDPESALSIPSHNVKRVARALEFYHDTGLRMSEHNARQRMKESPFDYRYFVLYTERSRLYERIGVRVDEMLEKGLLSEVKGLRERGLTEDMTSMHAIGYRQLFAYLDGRNSYDEAVENIKRETRRYAKRQLTWFRREKNARFVDVEKEDLIDVYETRNFT
ncbi:MAG: tRNA (adenosine(37)-N6)-dimethylallyltransferase MiaA [Lachnospiraceae bacterium]|nr:tRNA (adenosine(37)-N6)-dimethylallyltransferase MiaA [Lachnospiraceae bacterium]